MKYGIPTSQGAGFFVFYGQGGPALSSGFFSPVGSFEKRVSQ
jgi:hypothetical protein